MEVMKGIGCFPKSSNSSSMIPILLSFSKKYVTIPSAANRQAVRAGSEGQGGANILAELLDENRNPVQG